MGLSQDEIAYLLGCRGRTRISRYERFSREPSLKIVLAYEAIFGVPVRELFAGTSQKVEGPISKRARSLIRKIEAAEPCSMRARKLTTLKALASLSTTDPTNHP